MFKTPQIHRPPLSIPLPVLTALSSTYSPFILHPLLPFVNSSLKPSNESRALETKQQTKQSKGSNLKDRQREVEAPW